MPFISVYFILFIIATTFLYYLFPIKRRWYVLLAASYIFFFINSRFLIIIHIVTTVITFAFGILLDNNNVKAKEYLDLEGPNLSREDKSLFKSEHKKKQKRTVGVGVVLNLLVLLVLKYSGFFGDTLLSFTGLFFKTDFTVPRLNIFLPIGISFYTLQAISYLVDVSKGKIRGDRNLPKFMLFMSFFPQIVQGPITRYGFLAKQLYKGHKFDYDRVCRGAQLILWGFFKKMVIADRVGIPVDMIFGNPSGYSGPMIFLAAAGYGMQVYADFSGGMDVARGFSEIVGIELELNFQQPYFSTSIEDFWRRWHITLGHFMRDYVFYPLSLSKGFTSLGKKLRSVVGDEAGKKIPPFIAMFIVYFLVGFWHGPNWKYIAYGVWNGFFISTGILFADQYAAMVNFCRIDPESRSWRLFQVIRTFFLCSIGRFFARADDLPTALLMIRRMFKDVLNISFITSGALKDLGLDTANWILLLLSIVALFYVDSLHEKGVQIRKSVGRQILVFRWLVYLAGLFAVIIFGVYGPGYNAAAFIYEQF